MFDSSLQRNGARECEHFRHMSDVILQLAAEVSEYDFENDFDESEYVNWFLKRVVRVPAGFWCGREDCAPVLKERFLGCCSQNMVKKIANKKTIKVLLGFFKSVVKNMGEEFPVVTKQTQKLLQKFGNPMLLCKDKYKADTCEADVSWYH